VIVVVDASVILKRFVQEADSPEATRLRERHLTGAVLLAAPDLLLYEIGNALRFKRDFTATDTRDALSDLLHLQLELMTPTERLLRKAVDLAHRHRLTYYDSIYLAVANELETTLITADKRLHEASGKSAPVILLHEAISL